MSTLLAITLAAAATMQPSCSWDRPGANPYTGTPGAAIDRYTDIPEKIREKLKYRLVYGNPDETVAITRDAITGKYAYDPEIRDMHFGRESRCGTVTRAKWSPQRSEPGAVYCIDSHCILVPKICGNVSRIVRPRPLAVVPPIKGGVPRDWNGNVGDNELGLADAPLDRTALPEGPAPEIRVPVMAMAVRPPVEVIDVPPRSVFPEPGGYAPVVPGGGAGRPTVTPPIVRPPVAPVPEPETWAMLLGGLGLMGFMARRRAKARRG